MQEPEKFNSKEAVYTPSEVSVAGIEAIKQIEAHKFRKVDLFIPTINEYFAPLLPGQVCAVIAQTSNYKSGFMHAWEKSLAIQLMNENREEAIAHVSVEELIEQQAMQYFAWELGEDSGKLVRGEVTDWEKLLGAAVKLGTIPMYRVGESLIRAHEMSELYLTNIVRALKTLTDGGITGKPVKLAAVFLDYLQALPYDPEVKRRGAFEQLRRLQVREDVYRIASASGFLDCPWVVGVQAKQVLQGAPGGDMLLPGVYDGNETGDIAQRFDRVITLWMPKQTHQLGETLECGNVSFRVEDNLLWVKAAKQRGGLPAGKAWMCRIEFAHNIINLDPTAQTLSAEDQLGSRRKRVLETNTDLY